MSAPRRKHNKTVGYIRAPCDKPDNHNCGVSSFVGQAPYLVALNAMSRMFNPPHPGEIIREDVLPELAISVTEAARQLGVSRVQFSRFINGRAAVSADLAIRLAMWLGGNAQSWMRMQADYDLWRAEHSGKPAPQVERIAT